LILYFSSDVSICEYNGGLARYESGHSCTTA
jgi:hypothetical protein